MSDTQVILASASPRRLELLQQIGVQPLVVAADIDETPHPGESATAFVERMALEKTSAVADQYDANAIIVGSDTSIDMDGVIIGKPVDADNAFSILSQLSARSHFVHTGVALKRGGQSASMVVSSEVCFRPITTAEITAYWDSGEPQGKAGAYAIQGRGAIFVENIIGSYSAIMGLPIFETAAMLNEFGVSVLKQKVASE